MGNGNGPISQVDQAINVGFSHIGASMCYSSSFAISHSLDTAQAYQNEAEAGQAIRESGLKRDELFITTKYSGLNGLDIKTSINNSLKNVRHVVFAIPAPNRRFF